MTDVVADLLLAAVAVAMMVLALEVHSLKKSTPLSVREHEAYTSFNVPQAAKKSEDEERMDVFLSDKKSVPEATALVVVPTKQDALHAEPSEKAVSSEVEKPKKPFNMEDLVNSS